MDWKVEFYEEAIKDINKLDKAVQKQVMAGIQKVKTNPLPTTEGGYGKPLGNHGGIKLSGCYKIKFRDSGIRVVYKTDNENGVMVIIIVSVRADNYVYEQARLRTEK